VPDAASFEAFCREIFARIVRACALVTLDRALAEDVAAESFARLWARWGPVGSLHLERPVPVAPPGRDLDRKCNGGRWVFASFPREGVALEIEPVGMMIGILQPEPDTPFPIRKKDLVVTGGIRGRPAHSYLSVWRDENPLMIVRPFAGSDASKADRAAADRSVGDSASVVFAGTSPAQRGPLPPALNAPVSR